MSHYYTIAPKVPQTRPDGSTAKEPDRMYAANDVEKKAAAEAAERIQWTAKGHGKGAWLEAYCPKCSRKDIIENPSMHASMNHCGGTHSRVPEKIYDQLCILRDNNGRPRIPEQPERPLKVWY